MAVQKLARSTFSNFHSPFQRRKLGNGVLAFGHTSNGSVRVVLLDILLVGCWVKIKNPKDDKLILWAFSRPDLGITES